MTNCEPSVYCGTYHKYNSSSLEGEWINLTDFDSKEEFWQYCKELHKDEDDAEYMFQDIEGIPDAWAGECWLHERLWEWIEMEEHEKTHLEIYYEATGYSLDECLDRYKECYYHHEDDSDNPFSDLYFDSVKASENCHYLTIDIDGWLSDNYTEVEVNGETYYVDTNF